MEEAIHRKWGGLGGSADHQLKGFCPEGWTCGVSTENQEQERVTDMFP